MRVYCIGQGTQRSACVLSRFGRVRLFGTPWTVAHQVPQSMGFSRQGYWSGLPCPPPWDLPNPGVEPMSLLSPALASRLLYHYSHLGCPLSLDILVKIMPCTNTYCPFMDHCFVMVKGLA